MNSDDFPQFLNDRSMYDLRREYRRRSGSVDAAVALGGGDSDGGGTCVGERHSGGDDRGGQRRAAGGSVDVAVASTSK